MTYEDLLKNVHTPKAEEADRDLAYLHGFKTEAEQGDIDYVAEIEARETGSLDEPSTTQTERI